MKNLLLKLQLTHAALFLLLFISIAGSSGVAWGGTITVYNLADLVNACASGSPVYDEVILGSDIIINDRGIADSLDYDNVAPIRMTRNITINGNGRSIYLAVHQMDWLAPVGISESIFMIDAGAVTVRNLNFQMQGGAYNTFRRGLGNSPYYAIDHPLLFGIAGNAELTLDDVTFDNLNLREDYNIGAIWGYIAGPYSDRDLAKLNLRNVTVNGGSVIHGSYNNGNMPVKAPLFYFQGEGSIENLNISGFSGPGSGGGFYVGNMANISISGVNTISGVTAAEHGGGVYLAPGAKVTMMPGSKLTIDGCNAYRGGGIFLQGAPVLTMQGNASLTVSNNKNTYGNVDMGSGVYHMSPSLHFEWKNLNLINNNFALENGSFSFDNCTFINTASSPYNSAIFATGQIGINNSYIELGSSNSFWGAYGNNPTMNLLNSTVRVIDSSIAPVFTAPSIVTPSNVYINNCTMLLGDARLLGSDSQATLGGNVVLGFLDDDQWRRITSAGCNMFNALPASGAHATDFARGAASVGTLFLTTGNNTNSPQLETAAFRSPTPATMLQLGSRLKDAQASGPFTDNDQRGERRPDDIKPGAIRDIGSIEVQMADLPVVTGLEIAGFNTAMGLVAGGDGQLVSVNFDYTPKGYNYNFNSLINWSTSNSDIVEIEGGSIEGESGAVTLWGKNPGTARITVTLLDIGTSDYLDVVVIPSLASLTRFDFNSQLSPIAGGKGQTEFTIGLDSGVRMMTIECDAPDPGDRYTYTWNVANENILRIDTTEGTPPAGSVRFRPMSAGTTEVGVTVTFRDFSLTASCDVRVTPLVHNIGIKFEQPLYRIPLDKTTNTLLKVVHIEEEITTPPPDSTAFASAMQSVKMTASSAPIIVIPDQVSFEGFYVNGENVYIYVKPKNEGAVQLEVTLDDSKGWDPATCIVEVYNTNPAAAAMALTSSALFSSLNEGSLNGDTGVGTRVLQGPDLFESAMFRNKGTLLPLCAAEKNFFSILADLASGYDSVSGGVPLNWFAVKSAAFVPADAGNPAAPLGIKIPGGRNGCEADIEAPLGYPAEQRYLPMQAIFVVPRGVYGVGAHDLTVKDPSLLLSEYCSILLQLPDSAGKRTIDLFGSEIKNLTVADAARMGTLEFFNDTATGDLLTVLNFLLVDGTAPDGYEGPATYEGGLLRVYDGLMDGRFRERLWLAEQQKGVNGNEQNGDENSNTETNPDSDTIPEQNTNNRTSESSGGSGCNTIPANALLLLVGLFAFNVGRRAGAPAGELDISPEKFELYN